MRRTLTNFSLSSVENFSNRRRISLFSTSSFSPFSSDSDEPVQLNEEEAEQCAKAKAMVETKMTDQDLKTERDQDPKLEGEGEMSGAFFPESGTNSLNRIFIR